MTDKNKPVQGWSIPVYKIADEVAVERYNQLVKWGVQHNLDGTSAAVWTKWADQLKELNDRKAEGEFGGPDWNGILREEMYEAFAEEDQVTLREELIQCAAVIFAWVEDIDSRTTNDQPALSLAS